MARGVEEKMAVILEANRADLERARGQGHPRAFLDRLTLTEPRIEEMAGGIRQVAALPDPVGVTVRMERRPNGIEVGRVRVPIGVIGFIDVADREAVDVLLGLDRDVDLIVPRGGEAFVRMVAERAAMPVLKHDKGLCHVFVDAGADLAMATEIALNAKAQRPSVCNAMETLLVHGDVAAAFLPQAGARLRDAGVELRGCPRTRAILPWVATASDEDWATEYLDLILAVRVVADLDAAIAHIRAYGSGLAEAIVTGDYARARRFVAEVDAACVLVNASTRLCDGHQFGMGAELGISTSKLHARGPVGVEELTTTKFVVLGAGQLRE